MQTISKQDLKQKQQRGDKFALVEVLPPEAYESFHLPGAMNVPLNESFSENIQQALPDKNQEVVVYCQNEECQASPKAAKEMERLGYSRIFDYAAGKDDWVDN